MVERQKTLDNKIILTDTQKKKILEIIDKTKKESCQYYGWHLTLINNEDEKSGYPFIHLKIYWTEQENQTVIDKVNKYLKMCDVEFTYEDLSIFTNNYNDKTKAYECHNAICNLTEDTFITEWLLNEGIGTVLIDDPEDIETLSNAGLFQHMIKDGFSNIGKISDKPHPNIKIEITDHGKPTGKYFIPNRIYEIPSAKFGEWLDSQETFTLMTEDAFEGDFGYLLKKITKIIMMYRQNPDLFVQDYPILLNEIDKKEDSICKKP